MRRAVKIKICGITNPEDAQESASLGADYLGFNFYRKSPRYIAPGVAKEIIARLPRRIITVGVFVNEDPKKIRAIAQETRVDMLQFHGDESPRFCAQFKLPVIKALRVRGDLDMRSLNEYTVDYFLFDGYSPGTFGGTGTTFRWSAASKIKGMRRKFFLSGGLTPDNVAQGIRLLQPFAVDVASGVERGPGSKDHRLIKSFIKQVKRSTEGTSV